ncbi:MAG TPA: hypothetical protein VGN26_13925 [Armatimonadota bacterium]|jgi:hypothetical protein
MNMNTLRMYAVAATSVLLLLVTSGVARAEEQAMPARSLLICNNYAPGADTLDMLVGGLSGGIVLGRVESVSAPQAFTKDHPQANDPVVLGMERVYRDAVIKPVRWFRHHPLRDRPDGDSVVVRYDTDDVVGGLQIESNATCKLVPGEVVVLFLSEDYQTPTVGAAHLNLRCSALGLFRPQKDGTLKRDKLFVTTIKLGDLIAGIDKYKNNEAKSAAVLKKLGRESIPR